MMTTELKTVAISVDELRTMLEAGQPVTVLDVRTAEERAEWAIPGSRHIDAYAALKAGDPDAMNAIDLNGDSPVVTVCGAGKASLFAAELLRARNIKARSLTGGMKAWSLAWNTATIPVPESSTTVIQVRRTGKGCLSYLVGADGEAAVVDASLDPEIYLDLAEQRGWTLRHVLETHVHADHLSRGLSLAERAGATLHLPQTERVAYGFDPIRDGAALDIGGVKLVALHTPGHTVESSCYLLEGRALFTGDTLFLAGVGRPDLEASAAEARARARLLYHSLRRLAALPPETLIMPGHTSEPVPFDAQPVSAPLGEVRAQIETLRLPEEAFVDRILGRIPPTPPNHALIVELNEAGEPPAGDVTDLEAGANRCAIS